MPGAPSSLEQLRRRERLRVGQRFLQLRPRIAGIAALGNALLLSLSQAPEHQKRAVGAAFAVTITAFFVEAWWLGKRPLTERWLSTSLALTLAALAVGCALSGCLTSPVLPLLFAPTVVGFAAFARNRQSWWLFAQTLALVLLLGLLGLEPPLPALPGPTTQGILAISCVASLSLLAVGVIGLVDAHARIAAELDRLRGDLLREAERRALGMERLGAEVAHEVKNPLAAARGLVQLVLRHTDDTKDQQRLNVVVDEVDRALSVLQDYLGLARPLTDLHLGPVGLLGLLEDTAGVMEARLLEKAIRLRVSGVDVEVLADRQRLQGAVLNLALNAVTALPRGGSLELSVARNQDHAQLTVADDGPGMDPELLSRVGEPFVSQQSGGTGLGVLLAESVARQHGGALRLESATGRGVRATIELPLRSGEA